MRWWFDRADHPDEIEYVLVTDHPGFMPGPIPFLNFRLGVNHGRKCAVDGWNQAARMATGKFLISLSDDVFAPEHWDSEILKAIPDLDAEYVLDVNTGGHHDILTFSMLTRKYLETLTREYGYAGGFFYPEYLGMRADNEFTDIAWRDGVVVNARHLFFDHRHPQYTGKKMDRVHRHQQRKEAYRIGDEIYSRRRRELGFRTKPNDQVLAAINRWLSDNLLGSRTSEVPCYTTLAEDSWNLVRIMHSRGWEFRLSNDKTLFLKDGVVGISFSASVTFGIAEAARNALSSSATCSPDTELLKTEEPAAVAQ